MSSINSADNILEPYKKAKNETLRKICLRKPGWYLKEIIGLYIRFNKLDPIFGFVQGFIARKIKKQKMYYEYKKEGQRMFSLGDN